MSTLIKITNNSQQIISIIINKIEEQKSNTNSNVPHDKDGVYHMVAGSTILVELQRINVNQLNELQRLGQITYK